MYKTIRVTPVLVILGPTASGKTKLAAAIAKRISGEIISADSRQVYRELNIGTGKDYSDYVVEGKLIPYHLIDCVNPDELFTVSDFIREYDQARTRIEKQCKRTILCGGTGSYIVAALNGLTYDGIPPNTHLRNQFTHLTKEELYTYFTAMPRTAVHETADCTTAKRVLRAIEIADYLNTNKSFKPAEARQTPSHIIGLSLNTDVRNARIEKRLTSRLQHGLLDEGERICTRYGYTVMHRMGLEYKFMALHLSGTLTYAEFYEQLLTAIKQFAKRQMTYFRKMQRDGMDIHWIDAELTLQDQCKAIMNYIT
ncbi:MAG: tRNA (adenosine(37)-N6)-dimethylallyltransferase MiaA [Bacteroidota bacterium]